MHCCLSGPFTGLIECSLNASPLLLLHSGDRHAVPHMQHSPYTPQQAWHSKQPAVIRFGRHFMSQRLSISKELAAACQHWSITGLSSQQQSRSKHNYLSYQLAQQMTPSMTCVQAAGIPIQVLDEALPAATTARRHVLERMRGCSPAPRESLGPHVPRVSRVLVPSHRLGTVIGPGGRTIRTILEQTGCTSIDVSGCIASRNFVVARLRRCMASMPRDLWHLCYA